MSTNDTAGPAGDVDADVDDDLDAPAGALVAVEGDETDGEAEVEDDVELVPYRRSRASRVIASMGIAVGFVLVLVGISFSVTGREAENLPDAIQSITPVRSATQVQSQERIQVDLQDGYTGILLINGVQLETFDTEQAGAILPSQNGEQVTLPKDVIFEKGNYTLTFTPVEGALIEKYAVGVNTVEVRYWKLTEGPNFARSCTWQFDVV